MRRPVVCGIDWSRRCWRALRLADELAARAGLPLEALHITSPAPESVQRERAERLHDGIRGVLGRADVPLTIDTGVPAERLVAASRRAALIVVGTHSRGALSQKLRGSVSARLTRRSVCPVLVVPSRARHDEGIGTDATTVLCAARDDRDLGCAATAACWAADLGLGLTIASAVEPARTPASAAIAAPPPMIPVTTAERTVTATESLRDLVAHVAAIAPGDLQARVELGRPGRRLDRLARDEGAWLVVVGPRRHGALHEALFRSPTRELLRRGTAPLMVCPRADAALLTDSDSVPRAAPVS
jgi:nucleotide-binding universal stress UspA family protein